MVLFQTSFHWLHGDFQVSGRNSSPCSYWLHVAGWELYVCKRLRACERQFLQMEGLLLKWTNYLSGWKPRYFVLDSGILSYYDSPEDVGKVSKGSIKMAVCEIRVNPSDNSRMDLIIPNEQYFYLRAENAAERQKWLVALGSAKACIGDSATERPKEDLSGSETLGRKLSELRVFCNFLMQQIKEMQGAVDPDGPGASPDIEKVRAACCALYGTCSHISSSLEDCMNHISTTQDGIAQEKPPPVTPAGIKLPRAQKEKNAVNTSPMRTPQSDYEAPRQVDEVTVLWKLEDMARRPRARGNEGLLPNKNTTG
ncbi:hypothetical protein XENTR_v10006818 [Xenopus tropicalis]|uniref:Pleckstrin homology domain-containing family A member 3 n=1 Tax=Xenopus tropicalis TaxID=8364 RepID=A0A8J0QSF5_XENTR|nr:pleckstrin homology domain-containing family A member 3 [Xenopus tropicalis]KAE8626951.1 hypothetical protein XENTR_v10006818 [Xenopus tropicalis]KAE8626952.1 hypothetical protein XENTR_v10006818 [Xenopus tropicalis]|eukprot:XP_002936685.1 PREDICTED: pleckstrin homology domain-containing family A member 3-like [Xenopus tropicalis]